MLQNKTRSHTPNNFSLIMTVIFISWKSADFVICSFSHDPKFSPPLQSINFQDDEGKLPQFYSGKKGSVAICKSHLLYWSKNIWNRMLPNIINFGPFFESMQLCWSVHGQSESYHPVYDFSFCLKTFSASMICPCQIYGWVA